MSMEIGNQKSMKSRRLLTAAAAVGLAAAFVPSAQAGFVYDLRFADGTKSKEISAAGTYNLELWARVDGNANGNFNDDAVSFGVLSLVSNQVNGGAFTGGGVTAGAPAPGFNRPGEARPGVAGNVTNDGIGDWGTTQTYGNIGVQPTAYMRWISSVNPPAAPSVKASTAGTTTADSRQVNATTWEWRVATFTVNAANLNAGGAGKTAFIPQFASFSGASNIVGFFEDDAGILGNGGTLIKNAPRAAGTPIEFTLGDPDPGGNNDTQLLIAAADASTPATGASSKTVALGNVLLNSVQSQAIGINKIGTLDTTYTVAVGGNATTSLVGGAIPAGPQAINGTVAGVTSAYGPVNATVTIDNTAATTAGPGLGSDDANDVVTVTGNVGNAIAALSGATAHSTFGAALSGAVASGATYTNLASRTLASQGATVLGSEARILAGTNAGPATTVTMAWRDRAGDEKSPSALHPPVPTGAFGLASDVVNVDGTDGDTYVLQIAYTPEIAAAISNELAGDLGYIYLASLNDNGTPGVATDDFWANAVGQNAGGTSTFAGNRPFAPGDATNLGLFGVDTDTNTVWAVVNHEGQFAAIPEPGTLSVLGLGMLGLLTRRRRQA
jgi:hypothetical protein